MIGIFGGTFDPIHFGHLRTALDVAEATGIEEIRLVPLRGAVHRGQPGTPAGIRYALVAAAVAGTPGLVADDREISRGGPSFTVHTLESLRRERGGKAPLALILGADAFAGFLTWHRPLDILRLAHVIVMERPGHLLRAWAALADLVSGRRAKEPAALSGIPGGLILPVAVTQLEISSTDIRRRLAEGRSIRFLVPRPVENLIRRLGLYGAAA
jgi:nicotinate-nucleotide adenylyltransferase